MSPTPVWLLDIDGVLNAIGTGARRHNAWPAGAWVETEADAEDRSWPIVAAHTVLDFVREVHDSGLAEIRWHSTWQEHSLKVGEALKLPTFAVHEAPEYSQTRRAWGHGGAGWWKLAGAFRVVQDECRDLIWTDDDIDYHAEPEQLKALRLSGQAVTLVCPDQYTGLAPKNLATIRRALKLEPAA